MTPRQFHKSARILDTIMAEHIHFPGFPQIITSRGFAYQWLKSHGWSESERGFGSLDYIIFSKAIAELPLTEQSDRDYYLSKVEADLSR